MMRSRALFALFPILALCLSGCGVDRTQQLTDAAAAGDGSRVKALLEQGADVNAENKDGETALIRAAQGGQVEMMRLLLGEGADPNKTGRRGIPVLMIAVGPEGTTETAKMLLNEGADVDARNEYGIPALSTAVSFGNREVVKLFLDKGADPNARWRFPASAGSNSILNEAVHQGDTEIMTLLLNAGGDVNWKEEDGYTTLTLAVELGNAGMVKFLLDKGADPNAATTTTRVFPERSPHEPEKVTPPGHTLLMKAVEKGSAEIVNLLLSKGADPHARDATGQTAGTRAEAMHRRDIAQRLAGAGATRKAPRGG